MRRKRKTPPPPTMGPLMDNGGIPYTAWRGSPGEYTCFTAELGEYGFPAALEWFLADLCAPGSRDVELEIGYTPIPYEPATRWDPGCPGGVEDTGWRVVAEVAPGSALAHRLGCPEKGCWKVVDLPDAEGLFEMLEDSAWEELCERETSW